MQTFKDVDEYIDSFPQDIQKILTKIRQTVKKAAPDAVEGISYQMPSYKQNGTLIYFAAFKKHIGIFPPVPESVKKEAAKYAGPKGNLQLPYDQPIPYDLIAKIVKARLKEKALKNI